MGVTSWRCDTACNEPRPEPRASAVCPIRPASSSAATQSVRRFRVIQGDPQQFGGFFLDLQHRLDPSQATLEPGVLAELLDPWILCLRLPASLSRRHPNLGDSSRWRRQLDNCDEYKPSRRRRAATSPSPLQASASRTIRSLYSAVKRRRFACSLTSGSGTPAASRPAGSPVALRAPPIPPRSLSLPTYSCVDPPPPSTLIIESGANVR